jgi:archaellum biogenesis protein FlaJ (TadC family)
LILLGLKSGGEFSNLLDQISDNLKQQKLLKEKVKSSVMMYNIFIFCAISFGAPVLFGFSSFLIQILIQNLSQIDPVTTSGQVGGIGLPIKMSQVSVSPDFIILFIIITLITISLMGSFVLGAIAKGKPRDGLKFVPILSFLSVGLFFLVRFIVAGFFGGILEI